MKPRLEICFTCQQQRTYLFGKPYVSDVGEFLLDHGRSAILLALQVLQLPLETRVGVMIYNCHTVMNAVSQSGCTPVFIDVNDDLTIDFQDLKKKASRLSVLIVTHLFGMINNVRKIQELYPDLIIIEDCAHSFGIESLYGDFATFSIGQGKLPSIGDGGLIIVRNLMYLDKMASLYETLPEYSSFQSAKLYFKLLVKSLANTPFVYKWLTLPMKEKRTTVSGKELINPKKICGGVSAVYAKEKENVQRMIEQRKHKAEQLLAILHYMKEQQSFIGVNAFMVVVRCQDPGHLRQELALQGIDSATHFENSLVWAKEFGYQSGDCPNAEKLTNHLLMVPTY